jgi:epsilon-lactone hydrolase
MKETLRNFPIQLTSVREYARQMTVPSVPEGQHNFILGAGRVPEVDEAIERMGQWIRSRLSSVKGRAA